VLGEPAHIVPPPETTYCVGRPFTVNAWVTLQLVGNVYVINVVAKDDATPVTLPPASTVATNDAPVVHEPPPTPSLNVVTEPRHTTGVPVIAVGFWLTVTGVVIVQPVMGAA